MLGKLLFVILINDIIHVDNGIVYRISKFTDDTKMCRDVVTTGGYGHNARRPAKSV